jgi:broad specificity phosphatase PhoE/predicted kinase
MHAIDTPKLALVMVGLPARGKTYIARKLARYLCWLGHPTRVFNVGSYRRERHGSRQPAEWFSPSSTEGERLRLEVALEALDDMLSWIRGGGRVGIYDATNTTKARRRMVRERLEAEGLHVLFIESICTDQTIIDATVRETKLHSPDYAGIAPDAAVKDFLERIGHYEGVYESLDDEDQSYIQLIDVGRRAVCNRIQGYLPARLVFFLMNLHISPRPILLTRHGESVHNVRGLIGGDSPLSYRGELYAQALAEHLRSRQMKNMLVWTSTLRRTVDTARPLRMPTVSWRALDEIDAGVCDGMSYAQIQRELPDEYESRSADKFRYRYPRGESYEDVIQRLDPAIIELERQRDPVLIVGHQAVLRALYAYLMDIPGEECPYLSIPLHTLIELTPTAYGCEEKRIRLDPQGIIDEPSGGV